MICNKCKREVNDLFTERYLKKYKHICLLCNEDFIRYKTNFSKEITKAKSIDELEDIRKKYWGIGKKLFI